MESRSFCFYVCFMSAWFILTYSMVRSPAAEGNRFSASQEIPRILNWPNGMILLRYVFQLKLSIWNQRSLFSEDVLLSIMLINFVTFNCLYFFRNGKIKPFVSLHEKVLLFPFVTPKTTVLFTSLLILSSYYWVKERLLNSPTEMTKICSIFQLNLAI